MSDATREVLFSQLIEHFRSLGQLDSPQNIVLNWSKIQSKNTNMYFIVQVIWLLT